MGSEGSFLIETKCLSLSKMSLGKGIPRPEF